MSGRAERGNWRWLCNVVPSPTADWAYSDIIFLVAPGKRCTTGWVAAGHTAGRHVRLLRSVEGLVDEDLLPTNLSIDGPTHKV